MANTQLNTDIRSRIEAFLQDLAALVRESALESVRAALGEAAAPARRGRGRPRGSKNPRLAKPAARGGKRTSEEVEKLGQRITTFVKSHPGLGLEAIARGIGTSSQDLKLPIIKLLAARALSKKGQKRGTKYFAGGRAGGTAKPKSKRRRKAGRRKTKRAMRKAKRAARKSKASAQKATVAAAA